MLLRLVFRWDDLLLAGLTVGGSYHWLGTCPPSPCDDWLGILLLILFVNILQYMR
jgi:hypothetical protein